MTDRIIRILILIEAIFKPTLLKPNLEFRNSKASEYDEIMNNKLIQKWRDLHQAGPILQFY